MRTLCIIPCGKTKIWDKKPDAGSTKARDVYIGPFAKKCREYAEKFYPKSWCILSAKYGFLFPYDIVRAYNVTFKKKSTNPISQDKLSKQIIEKGLNNYDRIVVLGGKDYVNIIKAVFPQKEVHAPLIGCRGNGEMMKKINEAIQRGIPL
jgi:cytoplasmic iron level regulating protein YaaA (DUF328/UPF0246 family)